MNHEEAMFPAAFGQIPTEGTYVPQNAISTEHAGDRAETATMPETQPNVRNMKQRVTYVNGFSCVTASYCFGYSTHSNRKIARGHC